jgi:hypothetical protein
VARILVVIPGREHVRNLLRSGGLAEVLAAHDCVFAVPEGFDASEDLDEIARRGPIVGRFASHPARERLHGLLFDALMWRHRHRSRTFLYRWQRFAGVNRMVHDRGPWVRARSVVRWALWLLRKWTPVRTVLLGSRPVHPIARRVIERRLGHDPALRDLLERAAPDLILLPTNAYEAVGMDLVRLTRGTSVRTLFLVDNWDNLSSKTVLWARPDHLAVWGEQSVEHAVAIQGMAEEDVSIVGTARFDDYYAARATPPESPYPFPYVLFVGAALANDELAVLHLLDNALADRGTGDGLRVVYRPHPWQQPRAVDAVFEPSRFGHVLLDRQFSEEAPARSGDQRDFQPDLRWYPALLANARLVMGPLTTMLLEGSVCRRRVLALAHDDGIHFTTPSQAYRWYRHFEGIKDIEGFTVCHDLAELPELFLRLASKTTPPDPERVDRSVDRFVHHDGRPFAVRLLETVDAVLAQPSSGWRPR